MKQGQRWRTLTCLRAILVALSLVLSGIVGAVETAAPASAATGDILSPFSVGQTWYVYQGYGPNAYSHNNNPGNPPSLYGLDLTVSSSTTATAGKTVQAPVDGSVSYSSSYGSMCVNMPDGRSLTLTHIIASVTSGNVTAGQVVGTVANAGDKNNGGVAHVHLQIWSSHGCWGTGNGGMPFDSAHGARICGASDLPATGPSAWNNGVWSGANFTAQSCSTSTPPPPLDTDSDGVPDSSDLCPTLAGAGYPDGCTPVPGKLTGDFNSDGKQDIAAFYRYDGNVTRLFTFTGNGDGTFGGPVMGSYQPGWDGLRTSTAGVGDFNGDGKQDVAAFYRYDGNIATLFVFTGNGDGTFSGPVAGSIQTGWDGLHAINAGVGDFNGDGKTDVATFYRYDGNVTRLFTFTGNGDGTFSGPVTGSYQPGWDGLRTITAGVADFNGDGKQDVAAFYRYDGNVTRLFVFNGSGDGTFSGPTMGSYQPGWDGLRTLSVGIGDFNSDNKPDVATFYRYDGNVTGLFVFSGNGDSTFSGPVADPYQTGWDGLRTITAGVADFNGDGKSDVATFYRYDGNVTRLFTFASHGNNTFANPLVGSTQTGWDGLRTIM